MDTIINQLDVKNRILYNSDEGYYIFVDKPTNLGEYPKIDMSLVDTKYFDVQFSKKADKTSNKLGSGMKINKLLYEIRNQILPTSKW